MGQSDEQRCSDGYLGTEGSTDMHELPEILFFVAAILAVFALAATTTRWRVITTVAYLACASVITTLLWGAAYVWLGVFVATALLAMLFVVQNYLYSLDDPDVNNQEATVPDVTSDR